MSRGIRSIINSVCHGDKPLLIANAGCGKLDATLYATPHEFLLCNIPGVQRTETLPKNVMLLEPGDNQVPIDLSPNLIVAEHKERELSFGKSLSRRIGVSCLCFWLTPPNPKWTAAKHRMIAGARGDINCFGDKTLRDAWDFDGLVLNGNLNEILIYSAHHAFLPRN